MNIAATKSRPLLIVVSAPSGAGKTTLCQNVLAANPGIRRAVTCTTRPPRPGETDGVDYHFLSPEAFATRVVNGEFLEHATVYRNQYGTLRSEVLNKLNAGFDVLLNIDVQGAESVRRMAGQDAELGPALVTVFLTTATWTELEARLRGRGTESKEVLETRLQTAREELAQAPRFDYRLVSGTQSEDVSKLETIIAAEHMKTSRAISTDA